MASNTRDLESETGAQPPPPPDETPNEAATVAPAPVAAETISPTDRHAFAILDRISDPVIALDAHWHCTYANQKAAQLFGRRPENLVGKHLWTELPDQVGQPLYHACHKALTDQIPLEIEEYFPSFDRWFENRIQPSESGLTVFFNDVSERRHTKTALAESQQNFQTITEAMEAGITLTRLSDQTVLYANPFARQLFGVAPETDLTGYKCHQFFQSTAAHDEIIRLLVKEGQLGPRDLALKRMDGTPFWAIASFRRITYNGVEAVLATQHEITHRKRIEEALRAAEERYRSIVETATEGIWVIDANSNTTFVNARMADLLGYTAAEMTGASLYHFMDDEGKAIAAANVERRRNGIREEHDFKFRHKNGSEVWVILGTRPFFDANGDYAGVLGMMTDITARRHAEQEREKLLREAQRREAVLRESQEQFQAISEATPATIVIARLSDGVILYANAQARLVYGMSLDAESTLYRASDFYQDPAERDEIAREVSENRFVGARAIAAKRLDGTPIWVLGSFRHLIYGGEEAVLGSHYDITERRRSEVERERLQKQIIQTEKLAALGEFVAGIAHEVNNPLAAISGYAQLLQMHPDEAVHSDAQGIRTMTERATRILQSLLSYARPSGGDRRQLTGLNAVITSALDIISYRMRRADVTLTLTLAGELPLVLVNVGEIEQVVVNLLNNAEHALRGVPVERRTIQITTGKGTANGAAPPRPACFLKIQDNGGGMPDAVRAKIFDPFFTTKDRAEGTGLGLYVSHGIITAHGGSIDVASREGEGTTFTITLPAAPPATASMKREESEPPPE